MIDQQETLSELDYLNGQSKDLLEILQILCGDDFGNSLQERNRRSSLLDVIILVNEKLAQVIKDAWTNSYQTKSPTKQQNVGGDKQ